MKDYRYADIQSFLDEIMAAKESLDVEFKSARGGFPRSFWETYSSFANTEGGLIVLGIKEKAGRFYIDELSDEMIEKYLKEFWSGVNNRDIVSCNLMKNDDVSVGSYDGSKVLLFHVPRAGREQRPVYHTPNPYNGTYKRNYEGDFKCTEKEVQRMYADADTTHSADSRILENFSASDIDGPSLEQYRRLFDLARPGHPWLQLDDLGLLRKLGGYRKDRQTGKEGLTLAALLMFGKYESIVEEECAPCFFPDYREIPEDTSEVRWIDRIYPDGTWEPNLFQFYRKVLPKLQEVLPKPFRLEGDMRRDETSAHVAVREALVNALIHTDYSINASIVINRHKNKLIFSNPGSLLISKSQYYEGGDSICRNLALQKMFMMLGRAEKAGSGVDKILTGWKDAHWRRPIVEEKWRPDKVELCLPLEAVFGGSIRKELVSRFGESISTLDHNEIITLALACAEDTISNERLRFALDMHRFDISQMLKDLCHRGFLEAVGIGRGTKYHLKTAVGETESSLAQENKGISSGLRGGAKGVSSDLRGEAKGGSSGLRGEAKGVSSGRTRMKKEELFALVQSVCQDWKSIEEIASEVGKSLRYIQRIVPGMCKNNLLERLYPMLNHPAQKYKRKA